MFILREHSVVLQNNAGSDYRKFDIEVMQFVFRICLDLIDREACDFFSEKSEIVSDFVENSWSSHYLLI